MQYMIVNEDGQVCFVEYLCAPDEEVDEEDEDELHWTAARSHHTQDSCESQSALPKVVNNVKNLNGQKR